MRGQLILGFFLAARLTIGGDNSVIILAEYPATPITTIATEQYRFNSSVCSLADMEQRRGAVHATVRCSDLRRLGESREFSHSEFHLDGAADGTQHLQAILRSPLLGDVQTQGHATIALRLPGPVLRANAEKVRGPKALWRAPAHQYATAEGIAIDVTYRSDGQR